MTLSMLSAGVEDADILFENELSEERSYSMVQGPLLTFHRSKLGLAIISMLGIPWYIGKGFLTPCSSKLKEYGRT